MKNFKETSVKKYSNEEVLKNINYFVKLEEHLILERKSINSEILKVKKNIEYWKTLNINQTKLF